MLDWFGGRRRKEITKQRADRACACARKNTHSGRNREPAWRGAIHSLVSNWKKKERVYVEHCIHHRKGYSDSEIADCDIYLSVCADGSRGLIPHSVRPEQRASERDCSGREAGYGCLYVEAARWIDPGLAGSVSSNDAPALSLEGAGSTTGGPMSIVSAALPVDQLLPTYENAHHTS